MIRPPGFRGAAFGAAGDGDAKRDDRARRRIAAGLGIGAEWALTRQVHGTEVRTATAPGHLGAADGIVTTTAGLPIAVVTADCVPVIFEGPAGAGIAHAGWKGAAAGVAGAVRAALAAAGAPPARAAVGPAIGPCCYEVGAEVAELFPDHVDRTRWGTTSVDLPGAVAAQLDGLEVWRSEICTMCGDGYHSYRRDRTAERQVAVAWLPTG